MSELERDPISDMPWPGPVEPRAEVSNAIRRQCTAGLGPRMRLRAGHRLAISLLLSAAIISYLVYFGASHGRPESALRGALYGAIGWSVVQAIVLFFGLTRPPGRRISRRLRVALLLGVPLAFLIYLVFAGAGAAPLYDVTHGVQGAWTLRCGGFALAFGALASLGMLLVWRGTDPLTPGLSGALAGVAGGLAGACAIGCGCAATETWHLILSHGSILIAFGAIGWAFGRRWLAP